MLPSRVVGSSRNFPATLGVLIALLLAAAPGSRAQATHVTIDGTITIVVSAQEPGPVHRATQDLVGDFTKVFGKAPKVVESLDAAGPVALVIAGGSRLPAGVECATAHGYGGFRIFARQAAWGWSNSPPRRLPYGG